MARKARAKPSARSRAKPSARSKPASSAAPKDRIIDAMMALLATRDFARVSLADIAEEAGVSLGAFRESFDGKLAVVAEFSRRIDKVVLDGGPAEGETVRDRLFELLMRRFDALDPYKPAVRSLAHAARRDLCLAGFFHRNSVRSQKWILAAAGTDKSGAVARMAVEGLVLVNAEVLRTWLDDEDPGHAKTMAALDRGLARGERAIKFLDNVCSRFRPFASRDRATRGGAAVTN